MISPDLQTKIEVLYNTYNYTLKPLLATVEARFEKFPLPVINEIRAFNDHIAQCYREDVDDEYRKNQLHRAEAHINRILFDCFKYLNVSLHDSIKLLQREARNVDLTVIDNGLFYQNYRRLYNSARSTVRLAKKEESFNRDVSYGLYEEAFNRYNELEELWLNHLPDIHRARIRFRIRRFLKFLGWLAAAILSGIVSGLLFGG